MRKKIEKNFWDMEIIGNRRKKKYVLRKSDVRAKNFVKTKEEKKTVLLHFVNFHNLFLLLLLH